MRRALTGDGTVSAHVTSQQATNPWAKAGVMLRATTDPGSPYYAVFVTPAQGIAVQWRAAQGAGSQNILSAGTAPTYLRVSRYTTTGTDPQTYFSAFTSPDGANWTLIPGSSQALSLPQPLMGGLAMTSHAQGTGGAVTLDTVAVTPGEFPGPTLACPTGWSCGDLGAVAPAGGQSVSGSLWTVQGGGPDIWGTADAFHFAWQSLPANGTVSGQVTSIQAADPWAKSGVMLRATTDPGSPYYAALLTKGNGLAVQVRTAQGTAAQGVTSAAGVPPEYLQISRSGTSFTVFTSSDGVTWTALPGSTLSVPTLSGSLMAGVGVSSHQTGALSAVGFNAPIVVAGP